MAGNAIGAVKPFIEPKSVALIGVSTRTGPGTFNILEELLNHGYQGNIYPVNPKGGEILGIKTYKSVLELPVTPDVAVISTPRAAVPEVVRQCVSREIRGIIIISQGFQDACDENGHRLHEEIMDAIKDSQTRIIGPNTLGVINNFNRFSTSFVPIDAACNNVGVICQSGIFMAGAGDFTGGIGIGIDIGNASDLEFSDILEYLGEDRRIEVVNIHMEGLRDGNRFLDVVQKVSARKPVLILKTGTSEIGARAAGSHSGSLAGEDHVYSAAFRQAGAIRVSDVDEMGYLNKTFVTYKSMPGKRIAVLTISGGAGIIAVDAAEKHGLEIAKFNDNTIQTLQEIFPDWMSPGNPADFWPAGMSKGYHKIFSLSLEAILSDPGVDSVLLVTPAYTTPADDPLNITDLADSIAAKYPEKPTAVWIFGPYRDNYTTLFEEKGHIMVYPTANRAMKALAHLYSYHNQQRPVSKQVISEPEEMPRNFVSGIIQSNLIPGNNTINEQALDIMHAYGIPVINSGIATTVEQAVEKAEQIGYPVVIKVISPHITHKSDVGGVKLNVRNQDEVNKAWKEIKEAVSRVPGARMLGVLVQQYLTGGTEVILGAKRDPQFGPVLLFGLGGIYTELLQDISFRIAPVSPEEAHSMIKETRAFKILEGLRGNKGADINALVYSLVKLGYLMKDQPDIIEIDINPMLVDSSGALALDGRIMLKPKLPF